MQVARPYLLPREPKKGRASLTLGYFEFTRTIPFIFKSVKIKFNFQKNLALIIRTLLGSLCRFIVICLSVI